MRFRARLPLLFLLSCSLVGQGQITGIDQFFDRFLADWSRLDPDASTRLRVLPAAEQSRLDGTLTEETAEATTARLQFLERSLADLRAFDRKSLTPTQRVSYDYLQWVLTELHRSRDVLFVRYPLNQFFGDQNALINLLTVSHPLQSKQDAANYLARLGAAGKRADEWIAKVRDTEARGVVPPKFILERTVRQMQSFSDPAPASNLLVTTFRDRLERSTTLTSEERARLVADAERRVADVVYPAWKRVAAVLQEQAGRAASDAGLWKQADGAAGYQAWLRWYTSTEMTPDQIHQLGLKQVARYERELDTVLRRLKLTKGTVAERYRELENRPGVVYEDSPAVRERVLADAAAYIATAEARMEEVFRLPARFPVVVRRTPLFREASSAAQYVAPAAGSSQPGIYYLPLRGPTFSRLGMRTLAHHEAVPGHHFQSLYRRQQTGVPKFRTETWGGIEGRGLGFVAAYGEGWGLYAETLAGEMGLFNGDDVGRAGYLASELFRAARLVVDTGIHSKRWTREQAIAYLKAREVRSGMAEPEVERYIVTPGQACSYMIGELKILELRERAKKALGPRFQLKDFHDAVLTNGVVPLMVLDGLVDDYIEAARAR